MTFGLVLSCEHASPALPHGIDLGVSPEALAGHAAWDEGAADVADLLAAWLGAPLHKGRYTRLFVDLNRSEASLAIVPHEAWGVAVPANKALTPLERQRRIEEHHRPHWLGVRLDIGSVLARGTPCLHVAMHSFTPDLDPDRRTFDLGVLYDPARAVERRLAGELVAGLCAAGFATRHNEPYSGSTEGLCTTMRAHFDDDAYAGFEIELSHALVRRPDGLPSATRVLADLLASLLF